MAAFVVFVSVVVAIILLAFVATVREKARRGREVNKPKEYADMDMTVPKEAEDSPKPPE
jgi:heme/copper-type cytochrome/quinol oxidase subunit 2